MTAFRPWHETAGRSPRELSDTLAALREETAGLTAREKRSVVWREAYALSRDLGAEPHSTLSVVGEHGPTLPRGLPSAVALAAAEARTAPRFSSPTPPPPRSRPAGRTTGGAFLADLGERIGFISDSFFPAGVAWHDPHAGNRPGLALSDHDAVSSDRAALVEQAEMEFAEDAARVTGEHVSPEVYEKQRKNRLTLRQMSGRIVEKLTAGGVQATRDDAASLFVYWVHSKRWEQLPAYRRICLIPEVASMVRAPKLAALEYWLQRHPYARFWTFTTGPRCTLGELETRLEWLNRKLRKLNHALGLLGVEIVFRSTEFGSLESPGAGREEREQGGDIVFNSAGEPLFHPHAHCVVNATFGFNPRRWNEAIAMVNAHWRDNGERVHWDAGGLIENARECCKYVTKPGDLLRLSNAHLARLFEITYRAKLCQPLGSLAREIRVRDGYVYRVENEGVGGGRRARTLGEIAMKYEVPVPVLLRQNPGLNPDPRARLDYGAAVVIYPGGKCLRRVKVGKKSQWVERLDHNRSARETEAEKLARANLEDAFAATEECRRLANLPPPSAPGGLDGPTPGRPIRLGSATRVMARLMPAAGPTTQKEPRVVVLCADGRFDAAAVKAHPLVRSLWRDTVQAWEAGRAGLLRYSVHTGTPTVHDVCAAALVGPESEPPDEVFERCDAFADSAPA